MSEATAPDSFVRIPTTGMATSRLLRPEGSSSKHSVSVAAAVACSLPRVHSEIEPADVGSGAWRGADRVNRIAG